MLVRPDGEQQPSAWRFPSPGTALLTALWLHRSLVVQSRGEDGAAGRLGAVGGDARPARGGRGRSATSTPTSSSTPTRSTSAAGSPTPAGTRSTCPTRAPSTTSSSRPAACRAAGSSSSRATATSYMRKHHSRFSAWLVRWLTAWTYGWRARRRARAARPQREALLQARQRDAVPAPRRGPGRGRRGVQPDVEGTAARLNSPRAAASSPGRKNRAAHSTSGIAASTSARPMKPAAPVGRQQQLAGDGEPARRRARTGPADRHSNATGNRLRVSAHIATSITA